jgi:hypothetical protein
MERTINRLKIFRAVATPHKKVCVLQETVAVASIQLWLRRCLPLLQQTFGVRLCLKR